MNSVSLTLLLFGGALACGFIAYTRTSAMGSQLSFLLRHGLRALLGLCVAMGVWASLATLFWILDIHLQIPAARTGSIGQAWWLGPASLAWAWLCFAELARGTGHASGSAGK